MGRPILLDCFRFCWFSVGFNTTILRVWIYCIMYNNDVIIMMLLVYCTSNHSFISSCSFRARARAVGVLMNSVASRSSFSSACLRTSAMTCASVKVGFACLV